MTNLPDDVITALLDQVWFSAVDTVLSPDFARDHQARERYRRQIFAAARAQIVSLRPDRSHPAIGAPAGVKTSCDLCGSSSSATVHLSDAGVDLRLVVAGAMVAVRGGDDEVATGRVMRMDTMTLGVIDITGKGRMLFSVLNVVDVLKAAGS